MIPVKTELVEKKEVEVQIDEDSIFRFCLNRILKQNKLELHWYLKDDGNFYSREDGYTSHYFEYDELRLKKPTKHQIEIFNTVKEFEKMYQLAKENELKQKKDK